MSIPHKGIEGSNPSVSATSFVSRQFASLMAPMGRADRAASGRPRERLDLPMKTMHAERLAG